MKPVWVITVSCLSTQLIFFFPSQTARARLSSNLYKKTTVWGGGFHSFSDHESSTAEFSYFKISPSEGKKKSLISKF